ncbi:MAG: heparinase II/III family protein [Candidatus Eisenbacteria bacterium]
MKNNALRTTLIVLTLLLVASQSLAYEVVSGHPRLYFRPSDLPTLRARCDGVFASDYQDMKSYCASHMNDSLPPSALYGEWYLAAYSFIYLMDNDTAYAARAKAIAQSMINAGMTGGEEWCRGGALFFDWCYDYLTPSERQSFGLALASGGTSYLGSQNWGTISCYHGLFSRLRNLIYPGLALYGEGIADATAVTLCETFHENTYGPTRVICCQNELGPDGAWFQGDYNFNGYLYLTRGFELWATATSDDPFEDSDNVQNLATYYLYETGSEGSADGGTRLLGSKQGDSHGHSISPLAFRLTLLTVARRYRDGRAQWLAQEIVNQGHGYVNTFDRWRLIVATDPTVTPVPPTNLPDSWFFEGIGTAYMRSGWDLSPGSDDVYAVFRCERFPDIHTHAHQNHFLIARGSDLLAIDSGTYDFSASSHHDNYFSRTVAHNTITVYDPNEDTFDGYANDGGQRRPMHVSFPRYCGEGTSQESYRGHIVAFEDAETFTYAKGDATAAYSSDKLDLFTREIVYLKPDVFVILDRVTATSPSFKKRWLLHSIGQPQVSGDTTVIQEGGSKLFVKTLLPDPFQITTVGGSGHQYDVNGVNYTPTESAPYDAGAWRIEVSPQVDKAEHLFLHVLYVGDASESAMPECRLVESDDVVGAEIDGHVVLFSKIGVAVDSATYEYGG